MAQTRNTLNQNEKVKQFYNLHHTGKLLILPNIWDCLGAMLLEDLSYPAIATASASVAFTNGYDDGQNFPFDVLLTLLRKIVISVDVPVTADIESGFAETDIQLQENIKQLIDTGVVGINIEDTDKKTNTLLPTEIQCRKIKLVKKVSEEMNVPLFINARTDVYIHGKNFETQGSKLEETLQRGMAYKSAGADCFFPIVMQKSDDIRRVVDQLQMPVNILIVAGIPQLNVLNEIGVARVSLGPSFLKIAIKSMKNLAMKLQSYDGLSDITENEITSDYLKNLVNKKH
ncbi:MAG: isocitrate lyase/phosphoenolpyruvate mutase family protein [Ginsengibacter sp.]